MLAPVATAAARDPAALLEKRCAASERGALHTELSGERGDRRGTGELERHEDGVLRRPEPVLAQALIEQTSDLARGPTGSEAAAVRAEADIDRGVHALEVYIHS